MTNPPSQKAISQYRREMASAEGLRISVTFTSRAGGRVSIDYAQRIVDWLCEVGHDYEIEVRLRDRGSFIS